MLNVYLRSLIELLSIDDQRLVNQVNPDRLKLSRLDNQFYIMKIIQRWNEALILVNHKIYDI